MINSTIAYNEAYQPSPLYTACGGGIGGGGGGIESSNVTIVRNVADGEGGGICSYTGESYLRNTLIAENQAIIGPDCRGYFWSRGYNLIQNLTWCDFRTPDHDMTNIIARITNPLGQPPTIFLRGDSPAIDGGNPDGCRDHKANLLAGDQIGQIRPMDGN